MGTSSLTRTNFDCCRLFFKFHNWGRNTKVITKQTRDSLILQMIARTIPIASTYNCVYIFEHVIWQPHYNTYTFCGPPFFDYKPCHIPLKHMHPLMKKWPHKAHILSTLKLIVPPVRNYVSSMKIMGTFGKSFLGTLFAWNFVEVACEGEKCE